MAADARPYKSKEQDGNGNEIILRDQQLVEQSSQTTMASTEYFEIVDVDGRMAKIPKDNMISVVREALGSLLNGLADQTTVAKFLTLNGNTLGASAAATAASVLGARTMSKQVADTDTIRLLHIRNYVSRLLFVFCYQLTSVDPSYCALIRVHRQNNSFIYNVLYKTGTPLMYYQSDAEYLDIYCKNTAPSYKMIFAMELMTGSDELLMDNAGTDVSSMTQISFS